MGQVIKLTSNGIEYNALEASFEIGREEWNNYKLLDGGTVRVKTTVARIYLVVDDKGQQLYNPDGSPMVLVNHKSDVVSSL